MPKHIISLDFDGCVFNAKYVSLLKMTPFAREKALFGANQKLFEYILDTTASVDEVTFFVGSNRQSNSIDMLNGLKNRFDAPNLGSCFQALIDLCEEINRQYAQRQNGSTKKFLIDKSLLADLFNDKAHGYSFDLALTHPNWKDMINGYNEQQMLKVKDESVSTARARDPETVSDSSKVILLYAQLHKVASESAADEKIIFEFIDDREDILEDLQYFFKDHTDLIPKNVTLNLFAYPHSKFPANEPLVLIGTGAVDYNYQANIKKMIAILGFRLDKLDFSQIVSLQRILSVIDTFKQERVLLKDSSVSTSVAASLSHSFFAAASAASSSSIGLSLVASNDEGKKDDNPAPLKKARVC